MKTAKRTNRGIVKFNVGRPLKEMVEAMRDVNWNSVIRATINYQTSGYSVDFLAGRRENGRRFFRVKGLATKDSP